MDTTPPTSPIPPETNSTIQTDLFCTGCGHNLRTPQHSGLCPECAKPVRESIISSEMRLWLRGLRHGITWLLEVLPAEIRDSYKDRYYALTEKYSTEKSNKELVMNWLDKITAS